MLIIHGACAIMQESGNTHQWVNGYPSRDVICQDIARGDAWLVTGDNGDAVGYFVFRPGPDPTYRHIYHGAWLNDALITSFIVSPADLMSMASSMP